MKVTERAQNRAQVSFIGTDSILSKKEADDLVRPVSRATGGWELKTDKH